MEQLRNLRKENNLSMKDLGKILNVSESTISLYESGKRKPDFDTLNKIADYFNVTTDFLLGRNENLPVPIINQALVNHLKELRKTNNLTQQEVADYLGITRAAYTNIENEKRQPDNDTLLKLADFFDVSVDYLLGRSDAKEQPNEPMPYIKHVAYEGKPIPQEILREVISDTRKIADLIDHAKLDAIEFIRDKPFDLEQLKMINTYIRALYYYNKYDKK